MAWKYQSKIIRAGKAWSDNDGNQYPGNWLSLTTDAEKKAVGLVWEDDPAPYDSRFYWDAKTPRAIDDVKQVDEKGDPILGIDGKQVVVPGLKTVWKNKTKDVANGLLQDTDWYVVRKSETDTAIPSDVSTYRAAVRTASGKIETAIDNAADHAAFVALFDTPTDSNKKPTGNAPINDWPDPLD
jgi:hypothetical protein|tara:strand:+ start:582 stop:1133 length:552 start_codon:yes stop_codon:yes gene_type:complete